MDISSFSTPVIALIGFLAIVVLVISANVAVKKLIGIAAYFHLSSTFMGMTVFSLATKIERTEALYQRLLAAPGRHP